MPWYTYILSGVYIVACLILVIVVLLQSGKGDVAAAFGGGGSQTAFGPRGAASTLSKVTMGAAISFMVLAFVFDLPGIMTSGSAAHGIEDAPAKTQPAAPAPAPQQPALPSGNQSQPAAAEQKPAEQKPAEKPADKPADQKPAEKK